MKLETLDVGIGLIVTFLLVSTVCSALREAIEAMLKTRAAYLERAIRELLDDQEGNGLAKTLFDHPLVSGLFIGGYTPKPLKKWLWVLANGRGLPSYVPAGSVAKALLDIAARGAEPNRESDPNDPSSGRFNAEAPQISVAWIRTQLSNVGSSRVRRVLLDALDTSKGDLEAARKYLEEWFDNSMDRASGWYKRSTQWVVFVIAIAVTVGMNIDSVGLAKHLYRDETARKAAVAAAVEINEAGKPPSKEEAKKALQQLDLPIGWSEGSIPESKLDWVNRVLGWLLTAFAATLGAPFWFDVLNKVMVIRSTVKPREKSPEEFSEDRQAPRAVAPPSPPVVVTTTANPQLPPPQSQSIEPDCCGGTIDMPSNDADLPAATGGVAP